MEARRSVHTIEQLRADEWPVLRDLRLRALRDAPGAFLSDYDAEFVLGEADWRQRLVDSIWAVARDDGRVVGMACSSRDRDRPDSERHIESVWVAEPYRRNGVTRALIDRLASIEAQVGVSEFMIWILEGNAVAIEAYVRMGFRPTGEIGHLPGRPPRHEYRWSRPIR